jgi:type II secretion system protein G
MFRIFSIIIIDEKTYYINISYIKPLISESRKDKMFKSTYILFFVLFALLGCSTTKEPETQKKIKGEIILIRLALASYAIDFGNYPTTSQGLDALCNPPSDLSINTKWDGTYNNRELITDPWGMPYQYLIPGKCNPDLFDIWSCGPDRISGTDDDIGPYKMN